MPEDLQMSLLDVPFLILLMLRLLGQQTTKILVATVSLLFYLISNNRLNNILKIR